MNEDLYRRRINRDAVLRLLEYLFFKGHRQVVHNGIQSHSLPPYSDSTSAIARANHSGDGPGQDPVRTVQRIVTTNLVVIEGRSVEIATRESLETRELTHSLRRRPRLPSPPSHHLPSFGFPRSLIEQPRRYVWAPRPFPPRKWGYPPRKVLPRQSEERAGHTAAQISTGYWSTSRESGRGRTTSAGSAVGQPGLDGLMFFSTTLTPDSGWGRGGAKTQEVFAPP